MWKYNGEDEEGNLVKLSNVNIQKAVGKKLETLATICEARISDIIRQLTSEKVKKIKQANQ